MEKPVDDLFTKSSLSPARKRLVEMMQRLNFGQIEDLEIRRGEPQFSPSPRVVQDIKLGGENGPRPEAQAENFFLKSQVIELFQHLDRVGDGTVVCLDVKHGLPFKVAIEQAA